MRNVNIRSETEMHHYRKIWSFALDFLANGVLCLVDCCGLCEWSVKERVSQLDSRQEA